MLTHIHIRDFAIIEQVELNLSAGTTVLTGETGAGKSILVDALELALGARGDNRVVRHGCKRAEISAGFDVGGVAEAAAWLDEHDLDADGECVLRRVVGDDGRSRAYINGRPVPVQLLRELGDHLVDIHGQHEHQSLLKRTMQRRLLDDFAGHGELLAGVAEACGRWHTLEQELAELSQAATDRNARLDLLRYQVGELQALELGADEWIELDAERGRLVNANRLLEGSRQALDALYEADEGAAFSLITHAAGELEQLQPYDTALAPITELLSGAGIQIQEAASELRRYLGRVELDPERLAWVEQRLASIQELARKHRVAPEELPGCLARLEREFAGLERADSRLEKLREEIQSAAEHYQTLAAQLGAGRRHAAAKFAALVTAHMQELGMPGGRFGAVIEPRADGRFSVAGMERVEFQVSANPGQPLQPLNKVASGGELSRISLAIQVVTAQNSRRVPTLIFDEVDVGIGGGVAEIVGRQLRRLGQTNQVLCITHLPQVAALAHHHLRVTKTAGKTTARTSLQRLSNGERRDEVARMLGGVKITEQTLAHAQEMVERAQLQR